MRHLQRAIDAENSLSFAVIEQFALIFERWLQAFSLYRPEHGQKTSNRILRRDLSRNGAR